MYPRDNASWSRLECVYVNRCKRNSNLINYPPLSIAILVAGHNSVAGHHYHHSDRWT